MPSERRFSGFTRGFSLVELLLVVLIIAVLLAILFPVLGVVRRNSRITVCTAQLRQMGQAYSMYLTDYGHYPRPRHLVQSLPDRRILFCPEDRTIATGGAGSSYVFRAKLPPDFVDLWTLPEVDPNVVLVHCRHHLDQRVDTSNDGSALGPPRYPYRLVLRASGGVGRVSDNRVRQVAMPGDTPTFTSLYPGEPGYDAARR